MMGFLNDAELIIKPDVIGQVPFALYEAVKSVDSYIFDGNFLRVDSP